MSEPADPLDALLQACLAAAVPIWAQELKAEPWAALERMARDDAQTVAEKGDVLQLRGKKKGESARAFNALARGLAIASFAPGGVKFLGLHFENRWEGNA